MGVVCFNAIANILSWRHEFFAYVMSVYVGGWRQGTAGTKTLFTFLGVLY